MTDDTQKLVEEAVEETTEEPVVPDATEEAAEPEAAVSEPTKPVVEEKSSDAKAMDEKTEETTAAEPEAPKEESPAKPAKDILAEEKKEVVIPDNAKWFIIHTYAGHENKVAKALRQRAETMGFADKVFDIIVPTREVTKVAGGKKSQIQEKIFPGYVIVRMVLTDESWILVRTTPGVTAFIGAGNKPTPISEKEVEAIQKFMKVEEPLYKASFVVGEAVKIVDGPFGDFLGTIDSIDETKGKLRVLVSIFGRETPVELDFLQVAKI